MASPRPKTPNETPEQYNARMQQFQQNQRNRFQRLQDAREERRRPIPTPAPKTSGPLKPVRTPVTPKPLVDPRATAPTPAPKTLPKTSGPLETKPKPVRERQPIVERRPIQPDPPPKDQDVRTPIKEPVKPKPVPEIQEAEIVTREDPVPVASEVLRGRPPDFVRPPVRVGLPDYSRLQPQQQNYIGYEGLASGQGFYGSSSWGDVENELKNIPSVDFDKEVIEKRGGYFSKYFERQPTPQHARMLDQAYEKFLAEQGIKPPQANRPTIRDQFDMLIRGKETTRIPTPPPIDMDAVNEWGNPKFMRRVFLEEGYLGPTDEFYKYGTGPSPEFTRDNYVKQEEAIAARRERREPDKRNPHIQPDFYNSPEYKEYSQYTGPATQDMYYSPYFGWQGSGSRGKGLDRAYQIWAKRTGNEAVKGPLKGEVFLKEKRVETPLDPTKPIQQPLVPTVPREELVPPKTFDADIIAPVPRDPTKPMQPQPVPPLSKPTPSFNAILKEYNLSTEQPSYLKSLPPEQRDRVSDVWNRQIQNLQNLINSEHSRFMMEEQMTAMTGKPAADIAEKRRKFNLQMANQLDQLKFNHESAVRNLAGQPPLNRGSFIKRMRKKYGRELYPTPRDIYRERIKRMQKEDWSNRPVDRRNFFKDAQIQYIAKLLMERGLPPNEIKQKIEQRFGNYIAQRNRQGKREQALALRLRDRGMSQNEINNYMMRFRNRYDPRIKRESNPRPIPISKLPFGPTANTMLPRNRGGYISAPPQIKGKPVQSVEEQMLQFEM